MAYDRVEFFHLFSLQFILMTFCLNSIFTESHNLVFNASKTQLIKSPRIRLEVQRSSSFVARISLTVTLCLI